MDHNSPSSFDTHMLSALEEARNALASREVPVGCTFVCGRTGQVLATGRNRMTERCNATSHAELLAASYVLASSPTPEIGRARLRECTLYVTVEPCVMCAAAMLSLGVKRIVFGGVTIAAWVGVPDIVVPYTAMQLLITVLIGF